MVRVVEAAGAVSIVGEVEPTRAWAEIDLDAMASNLALVRDALDDRTKLLLVAKADAYGHGAVAIAHHAIRCGVDAIGVTTACEALELRRAGIRARIVVLGPIDAEEAPAVIRANVEFCVPSEAFVRSVARAAEGSEHDPERPARVHAKVDTGMGRLGVSPEDAPALLEAVRSAHGFELAGIMTHLAALDEAAAPGASLQLARFEGVLTHARTRGFLDRPDVWVHALNSSAVLSASAFPRFDAVRVGIAAYGVAPNPGMAAVGLAPILTVRTRVVHLQTIAPGATVGYGSTWTAGRASRIAVLPVGYDDGVNWRLSNRGSVLIRGARAPIVGRVSMDYTTVDVTDIPGVELGEQVTLLGRDGADRIRVEELAEHIGTIPYEVMCSIGKRVARTYVGGSGERTLVPLERRERPPAANAPPSGSGSAPDSTARPVDAVPSP